MPPTGDQQIGMNLYPRRRKKIRGNKEEGILEGFLIDHSFNKSKNEINTQNKEQLYYMKLQNIMTESISFTYLKLKQSRNHQ